MDQILNYLAGALGVDSTTFLLILAVVVAVCNLVGRLIPDDATGALGVFRKVAKVVGLYVSNRVTDGVSVNDTARVVAGVAPQSSVSPNSTTVRSPLAVGVVAILLGIAALFTTGCTSVQLNSTTEAICQSVPLAQDALDSATQTKNVVLAERILATVNRVCPSVALSLNIAEALRLGVVVPASH